MFVFDPYDPLVDSNPFPLYKILRDDHPCHWSPAGNMWFLSRYSDVLTAANDWETYSSTKGNLLAELPNRTGATLGTTDPPRHDRLRSLVQHAFLRRNLTALTEPLREIARNAVKKFEGRKEFDFNREFSTAMTIKTLELIIGLPPSDEDFLRKQAMLCVQTDPVVRGKTQEHQDAFRWINEFAQSVIEDRRANPKDDLISQFSIAEIDGDRLDEREVIMTTTMLIVAGAESMGAFMSLVAMNLADHPEARSRVVANPELLPDAIEESLRFNTSAQRMKRVLTRDVELHGQLMKAGDYVCLTYGAANRDERQFPNPDVYDIDRKPRGHLGFGGGVHACLGAIMARQAIRIAFEEFHKAFPCYRRVEHDLPWMSSTNFRSPLSLKLAID
ncbi:cytochrome [Pusillimonas sp. T2]|nr:cytochrome [Pusillimonas sp. T2]